MVYVCAMPVDSPILWWETAWHSCHRRRLMHRTSDISNEISSGLAYRDLNADYCWHNLKHIRKAVGVIYFKRRDGFGVDRRFVMICLAMRLFISRNTRLMPWRIYQLSVVKSKRCVGLKRAMVNSSFMRIRVLNASRKCLVGSTSWLKVHSGCVVCWTCGRKVVGLNMNCMRLLCINANSACHLFGVS